MLSVVQPDLLVICDYENINEKDRYMGTPSLLVEIISPHTSKKDIIKKLDLYMSTGVEEYWVVTPEDQVVLIYSFASKELTSLRSYSMGMTAQSVKFPDMNLLVDEIFN